MSLAVLILLSVSVVALTAHPVSAAEWVPTLNRDFPDPSVSEFNGVYYAYSTEVGYNNVPYSTSTNGVNWSAGLGAAMPNLASWVAFGSTWAPTVAENNAGQYVMFYAAKDASNGLQCIGQALAATPTGPFVDGNSAPVVCSPPQGGDIDPDIFKNPSNNQSYLLWKVNGNVVGHSTEIEGEALSSSLDLTGNPTLLLTDGQGWQGGIIEGPDMIEENGTFYLFYVGNNYLSVKYSIGYATCARPLGPCEDSTNNPVLVSSGGMASPGGPSIYFGRNGLDMAFAGWGSTIGYDNGGYRPMYTASVSFEGGVPRFNPVDEDNNDSSYWIFGSTGSVVAFDSQSFGSRPLDTFSPIVGAGADPAGGGYWTVAADGAIYAYGNSQDDGGVSNLRLNKPIVGIAPTPDGRGYWFDAADGGVFSFGGAPFEGSMGGRPLKKPIVGMAADPATGGYWLVAADGGIFSFGAPFFGSTGAMHLNRPVVGMVATPDGGGYWLVASDGGVFAFGDAAFHGSTGNIRLNRPVVGITSTPNGGGYWLVAADGGIFAFGDATFSGSTGGQSLPASMVAVSANPYP
jgi:hypothetical protein